MFDDHSPRSVVPQLSSLVLPKRSSLLLVCVSGVACFALVAALLFDRLPLAAASKIVASTAFVAIALTAGARQSRYGMIVLTGLLLSWLGDVFLIGAERRWFLLGLVSFLFAHAAYISAFIVLGIDRRWSLAAVPPVAAAAILVLLWLDPYVPPELAWPVRLYTFVISLMLVFAWGTRGAARSRLIVSGACLFYLSDLSVAAMRFTDPIFPTYVFGLPLYYSGQICLALSVAAVAVGHRMD